MWGVHTDTGGFAEAACVVNVLHVLRWSSGLLMHFDTTVLIRTTSFSVFKLWSPLVSRKAVKQGMSTIWAWTVPRFLAHDVWFQKDKVAAVRGFANVASQTSRLHPALIYTHALITHHIIRFTLQRIGLMSHSCTGFVTLRVFMQLFLNFS